MLNKLIKYEAKTTARMLLPVYAGTLLAWIVMKSIGGLCTFLGIRHTLWAGLIGGIFDFLFGLMVLVAFVMTIFIAVRQFYRLLGDEGYLLLSLPVSYGQHMAAKLLCATGWMCVLFAAMQLLSGSTPAQDFEPAGVISVGNMTFDTSLSFSFIQRLALDGAVWVLTVLGIACGYLFMYLCMSIGMRWPNKRLFASVVSYLAISFICQVTVIVSLLGIGYLFYTNETAFLTVQAWLEKIGIGNIAVLTADRLFALMFAVIGVSFLLLLAANGILWYGTRRLLNKRLDLA